LLSALPSLSGPEATAYVAGLDGEKVVEILYDWSEWARPQQLAPGGEWVTWLILGGRGSGKTRAGAEWVRAQATGEHPVSPIALVGQTIADATAIMVEGESGLLNIHPSAERPTLRGHSLSWPNGAQAMILSASEPDRFRGPQFAAAWCDEVCKWPDAEAAWDMLQFALRLGQAPRQVATTTPRPIPLLRRLLADERTVVSRMATAENERFLAPGFLEAVVGRYRGTLLGRQELDGELIEDRPDALWRRDLFRRAPPDLELGRTVVAVDPPVTGHAASDACGIVVAARAGQGAVVLADRTIRPAPPLVWVRRTIDAFRGHSADSIVVEVNQGGDLVRAILAQEEAHLPIREVRATRGKWLRAEPVAALYERGLVWHSPGLENLEDEMCAFGPDGLADGHSPDRVDALVWALTELFAQDGPRVRSF
jgi:phage terminase large subunit-like protein